MSADVKIEDDLQGVVVRNTKNDDSVLLTLSSILAARPPIHALVLVDGSSRGISQRVSDVLNMFRKCGIRVIVDISELLPHNQMFTRCLYWAVTLCWDRVHHFDDDVVVSLAWWRQRWGVDGFESMRISESTDLKVTEKVGKTVNHTNGDRLFAAGVTCPVSLLTEELFIALDSSPISVLEDSYLSSMFPGRVRLRNEVGIYHCTRDTGGAYVEEISAKLATGSLKIQ